jgi:16S rRNA processing protein RimM
MTHVAGNGNWLSKGNALLVEMQKGSQIPYFTASVKQGRPAELIVGLEDVVTVEQAKKLVGKTVWVNEEQIEGLSRHSPLMWIGFAVKDKTAGDLGPVADVLQTGNQWLARLVINEKEVLLPLVEQMITRVDLRAKTLHMDLPDGLLQVYLES